MAGSNKLFPCASSVGTPLFPAYSLQNSESSNVPVIEDKEWLTNSSYTPENFKETFLSSKNENPPEHEIEAVKSKDKKKSKHSKKLKKDRKKSSAPSQEEFIVSESDSIRSQLNKKVFIEETGLSFERAYRIDSNKDSENIYYESLGQKDTAKYHSYPKIPIGCNSVEKNVFDIPPENALKHDVIRYFSKKALKNIQKNSTEEVHVLKELSSVEVSLSYIPLSGYTSSTSQSGSETRTKFEGVSVSWKAESLISQTSSKKEVEQKEKEESPLDSELRKRTIQYNQRLAQFPNDIHLWLEFVDFQDELNKTQQLGTDAKSQAESFLIEKKIAILDKALRLNPKSVKLLVEKLSLCRNIWKIEKVIKCWEDLIFLYPNDPHIWLEYVTFILTDLTYFNTSRVLKIYSKCLNTLSKINEGIIQSHARPSDVVISMIDIFSQLCYVLQSCGYSEKAVAAFQSLIELNLFYSTTYSIVNSLTTSQLVPALEPFWDTGAPRFGEKDAIGWGRTMAEQRFSRSEIISQTDLSGKEDDILYEKLPEWNTWLKFERLRKEHHWMPWIPNPEYDQTEDDIDDADRTVSFEDISCFLFRVQEDSQKFLLVESFIKFLGFNSHNLDCNNDVSSKNVNININNFDTICKALSNQLFDKEMSSPLFFKTTFWSEDRKLFLKNVWSQAFKAFIPKFKDCVSLIYLKFLKTLSAESYKEAVKIERAAMKVLAERNNRNCMPLWFEYIQIVLLSGDKGRVRDNFENLIESCCSAVAKDEKSLKEVWYFVRSYIDLCFGISNGFSYDPELFSKKEIVWVLMHIACKKSYAPYNNEFINPTFLLKALNSFKNHLEVELQSLLNSNSEFCYCLDPWEYSALDCAKCFTYFQYITKDYDAAIKVLKDTSEFIQMKFQGKSKSSLIEQLHIFQAELMNYHLKNSMSSLKPLQIYLYDIVEKYPHNAKLLVLLARLHHASSVISPTRRFFAKILRDHYKTHPLTWIFGLATELSISKQMNIISENGTVQSTSGMTWKIRSLYERSLDTSVCKNIPILWRSYLKFEILNKEPEKAKSVFHRAIQNCGWSKELLMNGIEYFPDDLKELIDFMVEKQMRLHTPLEEITLLMEHHVQNL